MIPRVGSVRPSTWMIGITLAGFALRLPLLVEQSIWHDESYSWLNTAATDLWTGLQIAQASVVQPPLYYLVVRPFVLLGDSEWMLRFPSVLAGVLSLPVIYLLGREVADHRTGLLAAALLAANPFHIWYAREARNYSLVAFFALLVAYFWSRILRGRRCWIQFSLISGLSFVTHYFCLFLPLAQFVYLLLRFRQRYRLFRRWLLSVALGFVPTLIWLAAVFLTEEKAMGVGWIPAPKPWTPFLTFWNWSLLTTGDWTLLETVGLPLFAVGVFFGLRYARQRQWLILWMTVPVLCVMAIYWASGRSFYVDRYFIISLPAYLLLVVLGVRHMRPSGLQCALAISLVVVSLLAAARIYRDPRLSKEDWRGAMALVREGRQAGDLVVLAQAEDIIPARYYYRDMLEPWSYVHPRQEADPWSKIEAENVPLRLWLVYRNRSTSSHLVTNGLPFDIYSQADPSTRAWLAAHRRQVVDEHKLAGITVLVVELESAGSAGKLQEEP